MFLKMADGSRFATVSDFEYSRILREKDALNTRRATETAVRTFKAYLREKGLSEDFESLPIPELNNVISKFFAEARQENGELYRRSSMFSLRHGLNRYLATKSIDLIHNPAFKEANNTFSAVVKELKRQGLGSIDHYPPLEKDDLVKMYAYFDIHDNVKLQEKVFVDIMLYFGRRGREDIHDLKVDHFDVTTDPDGRVYVYLKPENNQDDVINPVPGRMYSIPYDHMCPVKSFIKYRGHLSESCTNLFQRPNARYHQTDEKWYNYPLGKNTIGQIMPGISQKAGLSTRYTNHSLHVTSTRGLDWMVNPWLVKIEDSADFETDGTFQLSSTTCSNLSTNNSSLSTIGNSLPAITSTSHSRIGNSLSVMGSVLLSTDNSQSTPSSVHSDDEHSLIELQKDVLRAEKRKLECEMEIMQMKKAKMAEEIELLKLQKEKLQGEILIIKQ